MANQAKVLRGQLRQIAKEMLPDVMGGELFSKLQEENRARLEEIAQMVNNRLIEIENRSKDVQSFIMREIANQTAPVTEVVDPTQGTT